MGRLFGFASPDEVEGYVESIERMAREIEDLKFQLSEADRYAEAAEYTLKATFGDASKIRNKPGRKKVVTDA
jgi:histone H3/H4